MKSPQLRFACLLFLLTILLPGTALAKKNPELVVVNTSAVVSPSLASPSRGLKRKVAIARFTNETNYGRSFLLDNNDNPIGKQCVDILSKKLLDTEKFILLERADLEKVNDELGLESLGTLKNAADYLIVGSITAFGRRDEGKSKIFSREKRQTAFAKVTIRLIDVESGAILYAEEGSGEAFSEQKTTLGIGPKAGYDTSINDQALDAAISNLASNIIENLLEKPWKAYILGYSEGYYMITGSKNQGLNEGDYLDVYKTGKKVKNPQTGMFITFPGKVIGQVKIEAFIGDAMNELALASLSNGEIPTTENSSDFEGYIIQEMK